LADDPLAGGDGRAAGTGHVQVRHQGYLRGPGLFLAQHGVGPHLGDEPVAEVRRRLDHAPAEEVDVGIEEVRGDGQQPSQRDRLLPEDGQRHRVTVFGVAADQLGGLADRHTAKLVALVPGQPVGQQVVLDAGQRGHALRVAELAAVAHRCRLALVEQPVQRDRDVAEFSGHPGRALDYLPGLDDAAAESGADDH
jgi:hypothetical protein